LLIALHQDRPQSRFLDLIQKAHLAATVNARLIDAPHRIVQQSPAFTACRSTLESAKRSRKTVPRLDALNGNGGEGLRVPRPKSPM
jgi:hypothetical protein